MMNHIPANSGFSFKNILSSVVLCEPSVALCVPNYTLKASSVMQNAA